MHNLMGHMHLHSDSKPFKCLYCPSKFTLKGNLTRHMKVKHGVMDRGLDERCKDETILTSLNFSTVKAARCHSNFLFLVFRQRGRYCLSTPMGPLSHFSQEEPFDLSQKASGLPSLRLSQSDGESVPGSSCQEEDEESLYRRSQYSPELDQPEPGGEDQYNTEVKERGPESTDDLRPGKLQKPQKYQKRSSEESSEGEMEAEEQPVLLRGSQERLLQSEASYESEADEEPETICRRSYDHDLVSEDQEQEMSRSEVNSS